MFYNIFLVWNSIWGQYIQSLYAVIRVAVHQLLWGQCLQAISSSENPLYQTIPVPARDDRIIRIQIQIRIFSSNLEYSDSTIFEPNFIRIFESFSSNLEYLKHICSLLLILNLNWEILGALATCWSQLQALMDKTCVWMWLSLDTFMSFLNILSQFLLSAFNFPHCVQI